MALDETTQEWLDSKFDESGDPVESGDVDLGSFTDDDFIVDQPGFRNESELATAYGQARDEEAVGAWAGQLIDQHNADLALQAEEALAAGYGYEQQEVQPGFVPPGAPQQPGEDDNAFAYRVAREVMDQNLAQAALQEARRPTAEQALSAAIASATTESLASLAAIEESKAARGAAYDAQAQAVWEAQVSQAEARAFELLDGALAKNDAANYPNRAEVIDVANQLMVNAGYTQEVIEGMDEWQREAVATQAIGEAARMAGDASIAANVLGQYGWKGPRKR